MFHLDLYFLCLCIAILLFQSGLFDCEITMKQKPKPWPFLNVTSRQVQTSCYDAGQHPMTCEGRWAGLPLAAHQGGFEQKMIHDQSSKSDGCPFTGIKTKKLR